MMADLLVKPTQRDLSVRTTTVIDISSEGTGTNDVDDKASRQSRASTANRMRRRTSSRQLVLQNASTVSHGAPGPATTGGQEEIRIVRRPSCRLLKLEQRANSAPNLFGLGAAAGSSASASNRNANWQATSTSSASTKRSAGRNRSTATCSTRGTDSPAITLSRWENPSGVQRRCSMDNARAPSRSINDSPSTSLEPLVSVTPAGVGDSLPSRPMRSLSPTKHRNQDKAKQPPKRTHDDDDAHDDDDDDSHSLRCADDDDRKSNGPTTKSGVKKPTAPSAGKKRYEALLGRDKEMEEMDASHDFFVPECPPLETTTNTSVSRAPRRMSRSFSSIVDDDSCDAPAATGKPSPFRDDRHIHHGGSIGEKTAVGIPRQVQPFYDIILRGRTTRSFHVQRNSSHDDAARQRLRQRRCRSMDLSPHMVKRAPSPPPSATVHASVDGSVGNVGGGDNDSRVFSGDIGQVMASITRDDDEDAMSFFTRYSDEGSSTSSSSRTRPSSVVTLSSLPSANDASGHHRSNTNISVGCNSLRQPPRGGRSATSNSMPSNDKRNSLPSVMGSSSTKVPTTIDDVVQNMMDNEDGEYIIFIGNKKDLASVKGAMDGEHEDDDDDDDNSTYLSLGMASLCTNPLGGGSSRHLRFNDSVNDYGDNNKDDSDPSLGYRDPDNTDRKITVISNSKGHCAQCKNNNVGINVRDKYDDHDDSDSYYTDSAEEWSDDDTSSSSGDSSSDDDSYEEYDAPYATNHAVDADGNLGTCAGQHLDSPNDECIERDNDTSADDNTSHICRSSCGDDERANENGLLVAASAKPDLRRLATKDLISLSA